MKIADAHIEFVHHNDDLKLVNKHVLEKQANESLFKKSNIDLAFLAIYVGPEKNLDLMHQKALFVVKQYLRLIKKNSFVLVKNNIDLKKKKKKIILHLEGIDYFDDKLLRLDQYYDLGVRSLSITHNTSNKFAGGAHTPKVRLTAVGKKLIKKINEKNIILDLAHLSRASFFDVAEIYKKPLLVTHANINKIFSSSRNLTQKQIDIVMKNSGLIGLNFAKSMVGNGNIITFRKHMHELVRKNNANHVCIGSDLGGIVSGAPDYMSNLGKYRHFSIKLNLSNEIQEKLLYQNLYNYCLKFLK